MTDDPALAGNPTRTSPPGDPAGPTASADGTAKVWNAITSTGAFELPTRNATGVAVSPRYNPFDWETWHECAVFRAEVERARGSR